MIITADTDRNRGLLSSCANVDGMRHCNGAGCDRVMMVHERIDTEDDYGNIESYCLPCYEQALDRYAEKEA